MEHLPTAAAKKTQSNYTKASKKIVPPSSESSSQDI
jgi:hypothetical protein